MWIDTLNANNKHALQRLAHGERKRKAVRKREVLQICMRESAGAASLCISSQANVRLSRLEQVAIDDMKRSKGISESIIRVEKLQAAAKRRRENPMGAPTDYVKKPSGAEERPIEVWKRLQTNWRYIVQHSIKETSMDTYSTALRIYKQFCKTSGIVDVWLNVESQEF